MPPDLRTLRTGPVTGPQRSFGEGARWAGPGATLPPVLPAVPPATDADRQVVGRAAAPDRGVSQLACGVSQVPRCASQLARSVS